MGAWLAKLATQLPEPADIIERVGKYSDEEVARFNNAQQKELYWQLNYMLGRYKYRNREYEDAIRLYQEALTERPNFAEALLNLGHALKAQGNVEEARNYWRQALEQATASEVRKRLRDILDVLDGSRHAVPPSEELRRLRAVVALERAGTAEARAILSELAEGAADARLTREAKAALRRR